MKIHRFTLTSGSIQLVMGGQFDKVQQFSLEVAD